MTRADPAVYVTGGELGCAFQLLRLVGYPLGCDARNRDRASSDVGAPVTPGAIDKEKPLQTVDSVDVVGWPPTWPLARVVPHPASAKAMPAAPTNRHPPTATPS